MDETLETKEPDAVNMDQPLKPERSFEDMKAEISENIYKLDEALRSGEGRETILGTMGAEIVSYKSEREHLEKEIEKLGHCPEGTSAGVLLARSFFEADKNILVGRIRVLDGYLTVYEEAKKSGTFRGMFMGESSEDKAEPIFRGVPLETYERWVEQNTRILNTDPDPGIIDLFQKKVAAYQKDIEALDMSIHSVQAKFYDPTLGDAHPLFENDIIRLHLVQMAIQKYLDTYRDIVIKHQEEALTVQ